MKTIDDKQKNKSNEKNEIERHDEKQTYEEQQTSDEMSVKEALPAYNRDGYYTYSDYLTWDDDERWELIDGKPYLMSAPTANHQILQLELGRQLANFLKGKKCRAFISPFDVRLNHDTLDNTVVQPDVLVVCDKNKTADGKALAGAPDLAIEILSPSNPKHDTVRKFKKYMEAGIREYWIVDPKAKTVAVNVLENEKYNTRIHGEAEKVSVHVLENCVVDLGELFSEMIEEQQAPDEMSVKEPALAYSKDGYYTYSDYLTWDDDERWELIDGKPYLMSAPTVNHQALLGEIFGQLYAFLKGKKCKVYVSPLDVRLNHDTLDDTVVQPDVLVVCNKNKTADGKSVKGAPDLAIEILSPSNLKHDTVRKFKKYMEAGVREYWIVDPNAKTVAVNILENGKYNTRIHGETEKVPVQVLENCVVDLAELFSEMI